MKKRFFLLLICIFGFFIAVLARKNFPIDQVSSTSSTQVAEKEIPSENLLSSTHALQVRQKRKTFHSKKAKSVQKVEAFEDYLQRLKKERLVPFKVVDGKAVGMGDIVLGEVGEDYKLKEGITEFPKVQLWGEEIPVHIPEDIPQKELIKNVLREIEGLVPLTFTAFEGQEDALVFTKTSKNCYSYLGKVGGHQPIFLDEKCDRSSIAHEILHALGLIHEHSREDRDKYLHIKWEHIKEEFKGQFVILNTDLLEGYGRLPFDYNSLMLYPPTAFAKSKGKVTIESRGKKISPSKFLSAGDIEKVRVLYGY